MALNSMKIVLVLSVLVLGKASAYDEAAYEASRKYLTVTSMEVKEILDDQSIPQYPYSQYEPSSRSERFVPGIPYGGEVPPQDKIGRIIAYGKELVAFGESLYTLVQKGKPSNKTTYAPISVIPRVAGQDIDIFDTEDWNETPKKRTYEVVYENGFGAEVVNFRYSVIFSYGGRYNGKGAYITAAQIIPVSVKTLFGYDFSATMKLSGIQNIAKKDDPVAALMMTMQYEISTVFQATLESRTYTVTGLGSIKEI